MRVVIAEDLALLRDGLSRLLRAHGFDVVAEVADPVALAAVLAGQPVDVAIVDVRMPPTFTNEGLVAAIKARARRPGMPIMVLSQYVEQLYARELMLSGSEGIGYLLKDRVADVQTLWTRFGGWRPAGPCSTRRWWPRCWPGPSGESRSGG